MPLIRAVLFDWDGTLADTAEATFHCYAKVFGSFGIAFDRARFAETYSPDWQRTYVAVGLPRERWPDADSAWLDAYACQESPLLPGARACLVRLATRVRLGLVTSGDRGRVTGELERHGLTGLFEAAVFGGEVPERKPHPAALLRALQQMAIAPADASYVGDAPEDVLMARAAGVHAVAIPGGYPNHEALRASRPEVWAESLDRAVERLWPLLDDESGRH